MQTSNTSKKKTHHIVHLGTPNYGKNKHKRTGKKHRVNAVILKMDIFSTQTSKQTTVYYSTTP